MRNTIVLAAADWAAWDVFGVNWLAHIQRAGATNYLVAALDQKTADFLVDNKLGHCTPWAPRGGAAGALPARAAAYAHGSRAHAAAAWARVEAAAAVVEAGFDVVVSDLDAIWFK